MRRTSKTQTLTLQFYSCSKSMEKINKRKIVHNKVYFSKLHRISTSYACRHNSNMFWRLMIYVYQPIRYKLKKNTTNLGVCVWQDNLWYSLEPQLVLRCVENCYERPIIFLYHYVRTEQLVSHNRISVKSISHDLLKFISYIQFQKIVARLMFAFV
jgi:CRISPR/Cas system CMR-associated protein Cmr1 (group 7 of RAMP superfamily)